MSDTTDIQGLFQDGVKYFNQGAGSIRKLMDLMDPQVTVFSLTGQIAYQGKFLVRLYFLEQFKDSPVFTPGHNPPLSAMIQFNAVSNGAGFTDQGTWTDTSHPTYNIVYTFNFVKRAAEWRFSSLWGA